MSATHYVYSKLANSQKYTTYRQGGADLQVIDHEVLIAGGAGVANKSLITPQGVMTPVTDFDLDHLRQNHVFKLHEKNGFIRVEAKKQDVEKVIANMSAQSDPGAPLVDADFDDDADQQIKSGIAKEDVIRPTLNAKRK